MYNKALSACVDGIVEHEILIKEIGTICFTPYAKIDTNSIQAYGVNNSSLFSDHIDTASANKDDMTNAEYGGYKFIQTVINFSRKHDFDPSSFSIPVETYIFTDTDKRGMSQFRKSFKLRIKISTIYGFQNAWNPSMTIMVCG